MQKLISLQDDRRTLHEYVTNEPFCSAKALIVHSENPIGDHYHLKKKEIFLLLTGKIKSLTLGDKTYQDITAPYKFEVLPGQYHIFVCEAGSILLGVCDKPHDPDDDLRP